MHVGYEMVVIVASPYSCKVLRCGGQSFLCREKRSCQLHQRTMVGETHCVCAFTVCITSVKCIATVLLNDLDSL